MQCLNKYIGNPILSWIGRTLFGCPVGDFHCGLRGIKKSAFLELDLRTRGMEYASEMVIKASILKLKTTEVPIVLHKDGRSRPPHLRPWRDGWRHLRFMLILSPRLVFTIPGLLLILASSSGYIFLKLLNYNIEGVSLGINTLMLLLSSFVFGYLMILSGVFIKAFIIRERLVITKNDDGGCVGKIPLMEYGLIFSGIFFLGSYYNFNKTLSAWEMSGFGSLNIGFTMNYMFFCVLFMLLGIITAAFSFFAGALTLPRR